VYLLHLGRDMSAPARDGLAMPEMGMPMDAPWTGADVLFTFAMWTVMMVGMMSPSSAPALLVMVRSAASRGERRVGASTAAFAAGYFIMWTGFSAAAALTQWWLHDTAMISPAMAVQSARVAGVILIAAGLYQLTPLKRVPDQLPQSDRLPGGSLAERRAGALRMGLHHGAHCLGCCWALMLVLFAVGIMNLWWVAAMACSCCSKNGSRRCDAVARGGRGARRGRCRPDLHVAKGVC
jgi:predicted metal-binding membrane protein